MSVRIMPLVTSRFASDIQKIEYESPDMTSTIIDNFTASNNDSVDRTISVYTVPNTLAFNVKFTAIKDQLIPAGQCVQLESIKNQVLAPLEKLFVKASAEEAISIRVSGRQATGTKEDFLEES